MSFFGGLFSSARALHVADGGVAPLPEHERAHHANQRVVRAWTVAASGVSAGGDAAGAHQLTKLVIETPGLTVVRVRAAADADPLAAARVVATSDAERHLARLDVAVKHKHELRVEYKNPRERAATGDALGALVVEIELAHAARVVEIRASGGGDVVVVDEGARSALARRDDADVSLVALDPHSRLFALADSGVAARSLRVGAVSGGSVFVSAASALVGRDQVACMVLGDGRVAVRAPGVETRELMVAVVGARGQAQLVTHGDDGVVAAKAETVLVGSGAVLVQAPPARERDMLFTSCERLKVDIAGAAGSGCVDVAALASREVHVSAKGGARAVVQARERLSMTCEARSTVECVGGLPPRVDPAPQHIPAEMLLAVAHESRVWTASEPVPDAPTPRMLFEAPRVMAVKKAGFRETLRPLWAAIQSHANLNAVPYTTNDSRARSSNTAPPAATPAETPAWVNVMSDVAGAPTPGKSLD